MRRISAGSLRVIIDISILNTKRNHTAQEQLSGIYCFKLICKNDLFCSGFCVAALLVLAFTEPAIDARAHLNQPKHAGRFYFMFR
jgi:hypothetical protein